MVELRSFLRPVAVAQLLSVLREPSQHHHNHAALLPNHLPEVRGGVGKRACSGYVGWVARVVVGLLQYKQKVNYRYLLKVYIYKYLVFVICCYRLTIAKTIGICCGIGAFGFMPLIFT